MAVAVAVAVVAEAAAVLPDYTGFSSCHGEGVSLMRTTTSLNSSYTHGHLGGSLDEKTSRPGCKRCIF